MEPLTIVSLALAGAQAAAQVYTTISAEKGVTSPHAKLSATAVSLAVDLYHELRAMWTRELSPAEIQRLDREYEETFSRPHWQASTTTQSPHP